MKTAGLAMPPFSCELKTPQSLTTLRFVSHKDGKWQGEMNPEGLRLFGRVNRNRCHTCAFRPNIGVAVSKIRQLAKAERSPIPAIEE